MRTSNVKQLTSRAKRGRGRAGNKEHVAKFAGDAYDLGARALAGVNEIRKLINIETKEANAIAAGATASQGGNVTILLPLAQGLDITDRVGDSIKTQSIDYRFWVKIGASATNSTVRVLIVRDWNQSGVLPTGGDVLNIPGANQACLAQYNYINTNNPKPRFVIIFDETVNLNAVSDTSALMEYKAVLTQHAKFRGTAATIGSQAEGCLYAIVLTNEATNVPVYDYDCRIRFTDD